MAVLHCFEFLDLYSSILRRNANADLPAELGDSGSCSDDDDVAMKRVSINAAGDTTAAALLFG